MYIYTLLKISLHNILTCALTAIGTLFHTLTFSHTQTHSHTYQNTLIYALHTHTSHFTLTLSHFTLTLHTHRFLCKFKHTYSCMHTLIHTFKHTFTHPLTLENQAGPGFLWSSWWICNSSCFGVSISSALLELILNGSFSQIFQFKPFIFPRSFLVCVHNETWLE